MPASLFTNIKVTVCERLKSLHPALTYHNILHTLDVLHQSDRIARAEGITDPSGLFNLRVAALYHDTGFLKTYQDHEKMSCELFLEDAGRFNLSDRQISEITELIMATHIPQKPKNGLQKIICDADLDYLGREDFFEIGDALRREFLQYKVIADNEQWQSLQLKFLESHRYHTPTSSASRETTKQAHYQELLRNRKGMQ